MDELILVRPTPDAPEFSVEQIEGYLSSQRFSLRDPASGLFLLCGTGAATQYARVRILTEPDEPMPPVALIRVFAREIQIGLRADEPALAQANEFCAWLLSTFRCAVYTTEGEDISSTFQGELRE
jgi:hypothetical protein